MSALFKNRRQAGIKLAEKINLSPDEKADSIVLALPRGGVEVGFEIAKLLRLPMDVLVVRKVGHPLYAEYGIGAVAEEGFSWLDPEALGVAEIAPEKIESLFDLEKKEVARRKLKYRNDLALASLKEKNVIIVDDGLATGVTARLAARFAKMKQAKKVILAVPVCLGKSDYLRHEFDEVICLAQDSNATMVGSFFRNFDQVSDDQVMTLLAESKKNSPELFNGPQVPLSFEKLVLKNAVPIKTRADFKLLIDKLKTNKIVMLGESSHGTHEFYEWRRLVSQELLSQHGFNFIAVEGDWPPCSEVNDFIRNKDNKKHIKDVLKNFHRWPTWMWANTETAKLAEWMKKFNQNKTNRNQAGFYGLDIYSFFDSKDEVLKILKKLDPELEKKAKQVYACLDRFDRDERIYAKSLHQGPEGCSEQVVQALRDLLQVKLGRGQMDELFNAQQNARVVKNAEHYYSAVIHGNEDSWNVRDHHMMETLDLLLKKHGTGAKAIVWAHNSHIGDYRASQTAHRKINLGGLAREEWGESQVALVGFGTHSGQVTAARSWDGPIEVMPLAPGKSESYEDVFHTVAQELNSNSFFLWLSGDFKTNTLNQVRSLHTVGVVYQPGLQKNDMPASISQRYDGFVFIDQTHALIPLHQKRSFKEIPGTWPAGL